MDNERVSEIKQALDGAGELHANQFYDGGAAMKVIFTNVMPTDNRAAVLELIKNAPTWIRELLDERDKLITVVDAVKAYAPVEYQGRIYDTPREWHAVAEALAALE